MVHLLIKGNYGRNSTIEAITVTGLIVEGKQMEDVKTEAVAEENMLPQSKVNDLVGNARREGAEKAQRELEAKHQAELEKLRNERVASNPHSEKNMGGMQVIDSGRIKQDILAEMKAEREAEEARYDEQMRRQKAEEFVSSYQAKLDDGRARYEDFDAVVSEVDPKEFVDVIMLANEQEGTADIMYELARNPDKLVRVAAAYRMSPSQAKRMMKEIAGSMKINRDAEVNHKATNSPLPRSKPSTAGTSTGELKTISDFKNAKWLKG